jgi:ABC-2 type transport system permease protein
MRVWLALVRRELGGHFKSLTGYVVIAAVLLLNGFCLVDMVGKLRRDALPAPLTELFFSTQYFWLILLASAPVITMRTFAAEKSSGTYEALMTTPVGDWQVVLAKFAGSLAFFLFTWLPLAAAQFTLRQVTGEAALFEPRVAAAAFLGVGLIGAVYMALGCLASALTRSQIIAAMVSFLLGIGLWVAGLRPPAVTGEAPPLERALTYVSAVRHMEDFSRGVVDARPVFYYLSVTLLLLFLTQRVIESRRWK